jgi:dissimilatory sulfite reductase related protein
LNYLLIKSNAGARAEACYTKQYKPLWERVMNLSEAHLHFDATGFLTDARVWNEEIAKAIAKYDGIGALTAAHWRVIGHLRRSWLDCHALPSVSHTCHIAGMGSQCLEELFHGPREAWRVAGLPDPGEEARAYM